MRLSGKTLCVVKKKEVKTIVFKEAVVAGNRLSA